MSTKVAVLIPYYNGKEVIDKCLDSLDCDKQDIWLIDNSEQPDTFEAQFHHIVTEHKRLGFSKTVNIGLRKIRELGYTHVIILNQDAYFKSGHFLRFCKELENLEKGFLCPLLYTEEFKELIPFVKQRYFESHIPSKNEYISDYVGVVIGSRLEYLKKLGDFDEQFFMYFEENDLFRRSKLKKPVLIMPNVHVAHKNKASKMEQDLLMQFYKSELYFEKKHGTCAGYMKKRFLYFMRKIWFSISGKNK